MTEAEKMTTSSAPGGAPAKKIITGLLLAFVAVSAAYWIFTEVRGKSTVTATPKAPVGAVPDRVVVYYFHGSVRCDNCIKFEAYTAEALKEGFTRELGDGRVEWKIVDVEDPANEHFVQDYQLRSKAVIAARFRAGQQTAWKDLEEIWTLVKDKAAFKKYIQDGVVELLKD